MLRSRRAAFPPVPPEGVSMTPMIDVVFQLLIFFMLSMNFRPVEGRLFSQLPRRGTADAAAAPLAELRIVLCAGGDVAAHLHDKTCHAREPKAASPCRVVLERLDLGDVYGTEDRPERAARNREVWARLALRLRELSAAPARPGRRVPVILDADAEVPYEHVIRAIDTCLAEGFGAVEFAAAPPGAKAR